MKQSSCFRRVWAGFGLLLFLVTWRLWTPRQEFPQIPFFAALIEIPSWVDWLAIAVTVVSLAVVVFTNRETVWQSALIAFAIAAALLMLLNQHRFQPWAYQFVLFALIMANCQAWLAMRLMRWIVVSIYIYSAVSKFDYQFLHSLGPQFISTLGSSCGMNSADWSVDLPVWLALLFPIGELSVGIGLLVPRTRRIAVFAAIGLHILLLLILGPWGLSHQPGVLAWNLYFLAQAWMLFGAAEKDREAADADAVPFATERLCILLTGIVIAFPASEPLGYCDHWAAWELYSPRSSRAQIAIHDSAVDRLSPQIQEYLSPPDASQAWRQLYIDKWSLESMSVPIYPEDRFQVGVALAIANQYELGMAIHVTQQGESDRWTGERTAIEFLGSDQLRAGARDFRLNIVARPLSLQR